MRVIKHILFWLIGVVLGVAVLLAAVMAASYSFTTDGSLPDPAAQFGGVELEVNGRCWQAPLIGGMLDKAFYSPSTLSVQKLGVLYDTHPALTLPDWVTYATLTITSSDGAAVLFEGTVQDYDSFLYPANGEYKAELTAWRLPAGMDPAAFSWPADRAVLRNAGLERPARATGCYSYTFRFTIQASAELELSSSQMTQGGVVALSIGGMVGGETLPTSVVVTARAFGGAEAQPEPPATEAANQQFRNVIWPLYEADAREKLWDGAFLCPVETYTVLVDYGQTKIVNGERSGQSNSTLLYTIPGDPVRAPANGVVAVAQNLALTGNTVVIDHGCGLRSYLYGLASINVQPGQTVARGDAVGPVGETLTMDFKLGSKSISPWPSRPAAGCSGGGESAPPPLPYAQHLQTAKESAHSLAEIALPPRRRPLFFKKGVDKMPPQWYSIWAACNRPQTNGGIAQLGERLNGIQEVSGSIPLISTKRNPFPKGSGFFLLRGYFYHIQP